VTKGVDAANSNPIDQRAAATLPLAVERPRIVTESPKARNIRGEGSYHVLRE